MEDQKQQDVTEQSVDVSVKTHKRPSALPIARAAVIAGVYCLLTVFTPAISYGPVQLRVGEVMTLLPLIMPEAVVGLSIGCLIANIWSPFGWYDILFGTLATALAAVGTLLIGRALKNKKWMAFVAAVPPVAVNTMLLPPIWLLFGVDTAYWLNTLSIFATQAATVYVLGIPLYFALRKLSKNQALRP